MTHFNDLLGVRWTNPQSEVTINPRAAVAVTMLTQLHACKAFDRGH
jgi:hypothetical protein